jgi:Predicted site-specific integrase-resolvase
MFRLQIPCRVVQSLQVNVIIAFQEEPKDYMQELVEDFVEIVKSFASRIYGHRSHKYEKVVKYVEDA